MVSSRLIPALAAGLLLLPAIAHAADGAKVYGAQCGTCHQAGAVGVSGQFPKLAGRVSAIAATPEGRKYVGTVVLYGINGKIMVQGKPNMGVMSSFGHLPDADLAAVLNFVAGQGAAKKPVPFTAAEIASYRRKPAPTAAEVRTLRAALEAKGLM